MKKIISGITAFIMTLSMLNSFSALNVKADNPIVQTLYTADPAPMVYDDVCYLYTSHDLEGSTYFTMPDWQCYSSTDMQNWTHHGTVLSDTDFTWAEPNTAWAAQCVERNGKFYMYVPFSSATGGGRSIGVAVSDSPTGPFKDALGKPLLGPNWDYIDPTVFIDSDGQAYLYFGNPRLYYVKLNEDMISYSGGIQKVDMSTSAFGTRINGDENHRTLYEEGPWLYKRGDLYYLVYAASGIPENICYSTSSSPTGPWTFRGEIMEAGGGSFTNHVGICDYKGKSYFFYHNGKLPGGGGFTRSVAVEEFKYNPDGSIPSIPRTDKGASQIAALNPFKRVEAETICWSSGIKTEVCSQGGMNAANIENGDYIKVSGVDFKDGATSFTASVASATNGGKIEIRLGGVSGKLIGTCNVAKTGGWQAWENVDCNVSEVTGEQDLYLVFKGDSGFLFNVDWWRFTPENLDNIDDDYYFHSTFEGVSDNWTARGSSTVQTSGTTAYKGNESLFVQDRTASWNGASRSLSSSVFIPANEYSFSVNAMYLDGGSTQDFLMKLQYVDSNGETQYSTVAEATAVKGEWVQLANTNYRIPSDATDMYLYVETADGSNSFYIDEAVGAVAGKVIEGAGSINFILGDVNTDGLVNSLDVSAMIRGMNSDFSSNVARIAADADKSGTVDSADLKAIKQYVLGSISEFPKLENDWDSYKETASPEMQEFYSDSIYHMGNTTRIREKIAKAQAGEKVTVAYIGGSITEGGGSETCYAKRSYRYFAETFATGNNVSYINAGMSGTSSVVGLIRAKNDILNANPDVIFIEFSVNDHPEEIYKKSFESLVKQCLSQSNNPAVILIINRSKGGYSMQTQMAAVGKHYNVPVISMDNALTKAFNKGILTASDYFSDEYHPHAAGNALIADSIAYFYRQALKTANASGSYSVPSTAVYGSEYSSATMAQLTEISGLSLGSFKADSSNSRFPYGWTFQKNSANTPMTFNVTGKGLFILFKSNQNSSLGNLKVTVNGQTSIIKGNRNYAWGGPDADIAYIQNTSGTLNVSLAMESAGTDFTILGIGIVK